MLQNPSSSTTSTTELAIDCQQISKKYQTTDALQPTDLQIQQGEFFGLLGPNGAGKSTLINMIAGLVKPSTGTIFINGFNNQKHYRQARHQIGLVPQELIDDPFFNLRELLILQAGYFGIKKPHDWIDELLHVMALSDRANEKMSALSGGMKRRMLIAMALVHKPAVVILDEPTAGVDIYMRQSLWKFIRKLHQRGHTIILTTHYLEEAEQLCDKIALINHGKIVALEDKMKLLQNGKITLEQRYLEIIGQPLEER